MPHSESVGLGLALVQESYLVKSRRDCWQLWPLESHVKPFKRENGGVVEMELWEGRT